MNKLFTIALALILILPTPYAQNLTNYSIQSQEIKFDIQADNSVQQTMKFTFTNPVNTAINYTVDNKVHNIQVSDGKQYIDYRLIPNADSYIIEIFPKEPSTTLIISYRADDVVFHSDSIEHFFTEFSFGNTVQNLKVQVMLPVGYGVYQNSYLPIDGTINSDGQRIIVTWEKTNVQGNILFSVKFENLNSSPNILPIAIVISIGAVAYIYFHFRKKTKEEFIKGFREDEQKVIGYLEQHKKTFQNRLQKEFNFSRAKVTRIVMVLEQKGLVKKQRYGRTNRLTWLKK